MKNLFKNLMLVAVAAMAFTACTETNEEVNAVAKKTVITGVAVIDTDDTRSGFTGKEGDVYKSAWDGGENIKVFSDNGDEALTTIDADGKFTVEFDQAPNFITVCSPAEAWTSQYSCSIATEQTPRANSVDPAVHVLQSQQTQVVDGSASISMNPQNGCYGKMTIDVADAEIEQVKLDLKGLKYHSSEDSLSYTLNATNTQDIFWFTIEAPMTIQEFTVTAYCAGDKTLTKTVTIPEDRNLKFEWGRVSTFSVSNLTEEVANVFEPTYLWDQDFAWETDSFKLTDDDYFSAYWRIYLNEADRPGNNSIKEGKYTCAVNNTNPGQGQFCVKIYQGWTNMGTIYASDTFAEDTLEVKIVDGQYQILYTHGTKSHGYKGLPSNLVLPEGGGNEGGETPDPENPGEGGETPDPDPENPGDGGETSEDYTNWSYSAVLDQGTQIVTLTDKSGTGRVIEFKLNEVAFAKFYGDPSKANYFTDVKVDGVAATATAESWFNIYRSGWAYNAEIDMTINGVHYSGIAESFDF